MLSHKSVAHMLGTHITFAFYHCDYSLALGNCSRGLSCLKQQWPTAMACSVHSCGFQGVGVHILCTNTLKAQNVHTTNKYCCMQTKYEKYEGYLRVVGVQHIGKQDTRHAPFT